MKSLQLDKPHAIIMIGIQGSGKTFFAHKFAETFNAPFIQQAVFENHAHSQAAARDLVKATLAELVKTKQSIVLEVDTASKLQRAELSKILKQAGYMPLFVWVQVDTETAMNRTLKQSSLHADDYKRGVQRFVSPTVAERALVISGKHTYATQARIVLKKLSAPRATVTPVRSAPVRGQIIVR